MIIIIELNKVYCMDNLEIMKQIDDESIDLIYIDPPFSTGDIFKTSDGNIAFEDNYTLNELIEFLIPRIKEIHRILKSTGTFYLHGDYRFIPYMRVECDKIFGINNFRNEIIVRTKTFKAKNTYSRQHDTILVYSKSQKCHYYEPEKASYKPRILNNIEKDEFGWFYWTSGGSIKGKKIEDKKRYIEPRMDFAIGDIWEDIILYNGGKDYIYPTQKPKELLERIIKSSSKEGDIIADFFCGSGTTGVVAKELGRNYILCDICDEAIKITNDRLSETS